MEEEPAWHFDRHQPPKGVRVFFGWSPPGEPGYVNSDRPYLELIKHHSGVRLNRSSEAHYGWCYAFNDSNGWIPLPDTVETLEEAKALALVLWRTR